MSWRVIIPSACASNLVPAVHRLLDAHAGLEPSRIVVVDDGARPEAEARLPTGVVWVQGVRPFVFSRNVNLGVKAAAPSDTVIMGDDVQVATPGGFDAMAEEMASDPSLGVLSPEIIGAVGNPNQRLQPGRGFRLEEDRLAFICVMIPRWAWERVGPMDERFTGYGFDDVDYCWRVRGVGLRLGVSGRCAVLHDGSLPSSYRTRPDFRLLNDHNERLLRQKWQTEL